MTDFSIKKITGFTNKIPDFWFKLFCLAFVFFIFFPVNKVFLTPFSYITGNYSDFTTFTLYVFDLLAVLAIVCFVWNYGLPKLSKTEVFLYILLFLLPLLHNNSLFFIETYYACRIILYSYLGRILFYLVKEDNNRINIISQTLLFFSAIVTVIALLQFRMQQSLGLHWLAEPTLELFSYGIAKIVSHETILRGYATFPHPNILSGVLGLSICFGLASKKFLEKHKLYIIYPILAILGIIISVSRGTFIAITVSLLLFVLSFIWNKNKQALAKTLVVLTGLLIIAMPIRDLYFTRNSQDHSSITERVEQGGSALKIIKTNWLIGVGQGTFMLHTKHINPWENQPVHNFFLLNLAEIGIIATFWLIYAIFLLNWNTHLTSKNLGNFVKYITLPMFIFVTMLFDHYYSTNPVMIAVLWLSLNAWRGADTMFYDTDAQL